MHRAQSDGRVRLVTFGQTKNRASVTGIHISKGSGKSRLPEDISEYKFLTNYQEFSHTKAFISAKLGVKGKVYQINNGRQFLLSDWLRLISGDFY